MGAAIARRLSTCVVLISGCALCGCGDRPTLFKNPDPELRKTRTELKADARQRSYPEEAPRIYEPKARAQVAYMLRRVELVNFTDEDWSDVDVWVNRQYVCHVPHLQRHQLKEIHFPMLYDSAGKALTITRANPRVETVELYKDGTLYAITCHNADW